MSLHGAASTFDVSLFTELAATCLYNESQNEYAVGNQDN